MFERLLPWPRMARHTSCAHDTQTDVCDGSNGKDAAMTPGFDYSSDDTTQQRRDDATSPDTNAEQVLVGTTVLGAHGERLGTVSERGFENDMLVMRHSGADLFIPIPAIASTGTSRIFTTLRPEDLGKL